MKKISKIGLTLSASLTLAAPLVSVVSCGSSAKGGFYNYLDYMSPDAEETFKSKYGFEPFSDLPELRTAIENQAAVSGVGSDYYNAKLASEGLIKKVDFNAVFDGVTVKDAANNKEYTFSVATRLSDADVKSALKLLYTEDVWNLMSQFDPKLTGEASDDELWEYMIPYFIQQKVIAVNPFKVTETAANKADLDVLKGFDQDKIDTLLDTNKDKKLTYIEILAKLHEIGFKTLTLNNYMRDNLAIGSEEKGKFTMTVKRSTYKGLLDGLKNVVNSFTGQDQSGKVVSVDSGYESLMSVHSVNKDGVNSDAAIIYNGDALDAFQGSDQEATENLTKNALIRVIHPTNSTFLLDGIVIPTYIEGDKLTDLYQTIKSALYENANIVDPTKINDADGSINSFNKAYSNFDFVNYTTPIDAIYKDAEQHYFSDLKNTDKNAYPNPNGDEVTGSGAYAEKNIFEIKNSLLDKSHLTSPIDSELESEVTSTYNHYIETLTL